MLFCSCFYRRLLVDLDLANAPITRDRTVVNILRPTILPNRVLLSIMKLMIEKITHVVVSTPISINKP